MGIVLEIELKCATSEQILRERIVVIFLVSTT